MPSRKPESVKSWKLRSLDSRPVPRLFRHLNVRLSIPAAKLNLNLFAAESQPWSVPPLAAYSLAYSVGLAV